MTENHSVVGSIPTGGTTCGFSSFGRARPCQGRGGGFEPRNPLHIKRRDENFFFFIRKHSSVGRASALQAEGHRFEPYCFHHRASEKAICEANESNLALKRQINGPVVQLVRTLACHARGQGFESPSGRHLFLKNADLAHLVERDLAKVEVAGSSPVIRSIFYGDVAKW